MVPFIDEREIHDRCGMQKNISDMDTADAICQSDPRVRIAKLLAAQLADAGFTVPDDGVADRADALRLKDL
jgi:hypothetical protein